MKNPGRNTGKTKLRRRKKTEEQKYSEAQAKLDRESKKKMEEMEDREKMAHLPSETGPCTYQIRLPASNFDDMAAGIRTFDLQKEKGQRVGDILEYLEFSEGRNTGRTIRAEAVYILRDYTGLEDGYCILGIRVTAVPTE